MIEEILKKADLGLPLTKEDAVTLLKLPNASADFYKLISKANELSRRAYQNRGYLFVQIGINASPCSGNCKFCSIAKDHFVVGEPYEKSKEEILEQVRQIDFAPISAFFLMTTADYSKSSFLEIGKAVKPLLPPGVEFVANIGDFDLAYAEKLKQAGFTAAYHIVRLREGIDTDIPKQQRIRTLDAIKAAELDLYYCVEPIGREHTAEELADEMLRARDYGVDVMAVMARVNVPGTKFEQEEPITELELTKIAAAARLVTNPKKSMNVHEPKEMPLLAGVNQLYAEIGINPRDVDQNTENGRGFSVARVAKMLWDAEYIVD